ncbi:MAG: serine hydrolase [Bryobacterales bacterium]|nr:serine hydrolase [Bryobacterales bacterium]
MLPLVLLTLLALVPAAAQYVPPPGPIWKKSTAGFDRKKLQVALAFARQNEGWWDFAKDQQRVFGKPLGPVPASRAAANMIILRDGLLVAEFGDTNAADPIYSAAKSFLSLVCGLATDRGLIGKPQDPVRLTVKDGGYDSPHNAKVTWEHHLRQTSEWDGTLWNRRHDFIGREEFGSAERKPRPLQEPGAYYEYNDVRVNRLSLSLLRLFQEPLGDVLRKHIMDPIGASSTWAWHGYRNSIVQIDGREIASVPGGTRWGGGIWMSTRDLARVGLLVMRNGDWNGRRILSEKWLSESIRSNDKGPDYGYLWWLNTQGKQWPGAPRSSFAAIGNGSNIVWIDREHRLVVVWRWFEGKATADFLKLLLDSIQ